MLVVNENMTIDETLPGVVYNHIESVRPIGATVTVESPLAKIVTVTANVMLDGSVALEEVRADFTNTLTEYLKELVFDVYSVSYARVGSLLLTTEGVADYTGLLLNGASTNVTLLDTEMPVLGNVNLSEVI